MLREGHSRGIIPAGHREGFQEEVGYWGWPGSDDIKDGIAHTLASVGEEVLKVHYLFAP